MTYKILQGDAIEVMKTLDAGTVDMCVTSPPYYGLRDYGVEGQIGLEQTPEEYVNKLVEVFREVKRVLRDGGTVWLNLGDSYNSHGTGNVENVGGFQGKAIRNNRGYRNAQSASEKKRVLKGCGIKPKDLIGIPWRVAFALQADGWYLRSDIIWHKPNPMPESVKDRPTKSHEYIFLLSKNKKYYYDNEAIMENQKKNSVERLTRGWNGDGDRGYPGGPQNHLKNYMGKVDIDKLPKVRGYKTKDNTENPQHHGQDIYSGKGRNKRTVWTVNTKPFKEAHFAVFPEKLIEPCILAGSRKGGIVMDPFCGSGTTGVVCARFGRDFIGIELNPEYVKMAEKRTYKASQQMRLLEVD